MERVVVTRAIVGIAHMQVCAVADATDEEILAVCNVQNPSGTTAGWVSVIRENYDDEFWGGKKKRPVVCADDPTRKHFIVGC